MIYYSLIERNSYLMHLNILLRSRGLYLSTFSVYVLVIVPDDGRRKRPK